MPSNHTTNYQLSQWEKSDKVQMEDFNADNAKIDAALKMETDARTALAAQVTKLGNCQIYINTYIGTGTYGADNPKKFTFPYKPAVVLVASADGINIYMLQGQNVTSYPTSSPPAYTVRITWSGNSVSWYGNHVHSHMNDEGIAYHVVALCSKS